MKNVFKYMAVVSTMALVGCAHQEIRTLPVPAPDHTIVQSHIDKQKALVDRVAADTQVLASVTYTNVAASNAVADLVTTVGSLSNNLMGLNTAFTNEVAQDNLLAQDDAATHVKLDKKTAECDAAIASQTRLSKIVTMAFMLLALGVTAWFEELFGKALLSTPPPWLGLILWIGAAAGVFSAVLLLSFKVAEILSTPFPALLK